MMTAASLRRRAACCREIAEEAANPAVTRDLMMIARSFEHKARRLHRRNVRNPSRGGLF